MRVLVVTTQVAFVRGGAEMVAEMLRDELRLRGHETDCVNIPFTWYPSERILEQMLACRLLDLTQSCGQPIDRLIVLKFPAYLVPHPNKVAWILHQHRQAYELWDHPTAGDLKRSPNGALVRRAIQEADRSLLPEARRLFTNSANTGRRLLSSTGLASTPLYCPPPDAERFESGEAGDYLYYPSRFNSLKRQHLALEALELTRHPVRLKLSGSADSPDYAQQVRRIAERLGSRVELLGNVSEERKRALYAHALGVVFPPFDEDYGFITLEAMLSARPVITCSDSGGPLEFVRQRETGLVAEPTAAGLAQAMDTLWEDRAQSRRWGEAGRALYASLALSWDHVVQALLS